MATKKASIPICVICEKPKVLLKERLSITGGEVYVCTTVVGKMKMPCDGWIGKTAEIQS